MNSHYHGRILKRNYCIHCLILFAKGPQQFAARRDSETGYNIIPISCRALGAGFEIVFRSLGRLCLAKTVQLFCDVWMMTAIIKRFLWPKVRTSFLNENRSNSHGTGIHFVPEHVLQGLKYILLLQSAWVFDKIGLKTSHRTASIESYNLHKAFFRSPTKKSAEMNWFFVDWAS